MDDNPNPTYDGRRGPPRDPSRPPSHNGNSRAAARDMLEALELEPEDVIALIWAIGRMAERGAAMPTGTCPHCGLTP